MRLVAIVNQPGDCVVLAEWPDGGYVARPTEAFTEDIVEYGDFTSSFFYVSHIEGRSPLDEDIPRIEVVLDFMRIGSRAPVAVRMDSSFMDVPQSQLQALLQCKNRLNWFVNRTIASTTTVNLSWPMLAELAEAVEPEGALTFDFHAELWTLLGENSPPWWNDERFDAWVREKMGEPS